MRKQKGITLITTVITLPVILILMGLGIDLGMAYVARTSAQAAADAAALAGAYSYVKNSAAPTPQQDAVTVANTNKVLRQQVNITTANVTLPACTGGNCVTVTIPVTVPTFFSRVFGWQSVSTTVRATAQASSSATGAYCLKPIFAPDFVLRPGGTWLAPGTLLPNIRPVTPQSTYAPSNFYSLDFTHIDNVSGTPNTVYFSDGSSDSSSGIPTYRDGWGSCLVSPVIKCGDTINLQPGNAPNATEDAALQYTDTYNGVGDYGSNHTDSSPSLVSVAIWDSSVQPPNAGGNNFYATVIGFGEIFMLPYPGRPAPVQARFIRATGCTPGGGGGIGTGPTGAPLRLVRLP
jgi:Flp pilus assembly protein TadG